MLKTKVLANAIRNLTDARYFAARGVDWLGFRLDPASSEYVSPQQLLAMSEWVDGVQIVGAFEMQTGEDIREAMALLPLDALQLGPLAPAHLAEALAPDMPVIKELAIDGTESLEELQTTLETHKPHCAYFLLSFDKGGFSWEDLAAGRPFELEAIKGICEGNPVLIGLDFSPEGLEACLAELKPEGICLRGGEEEKVGYKSFDELDELLEALEEPED